MERSGIELEGSMRTARRKPCGATAPSEMKRSGIELEGSMRTARRKPCGIELEAPPEICYDNPTEVLSMNYTYIVTCSDGSLYTGWTNDLTRRLKAHNEGKGAKYTKSRRPVVLAYYEEFSTKEEAMRREWEIKHMTRQEKMRMISAFES